MTSAKERAKGREASGLAALVRTCPTCKAEPGNACTRLDGSERPPWLVHVARRGARGRDPKIGPRAGDVVDGVELLRSEKIAAWPRYTVLVARDALFAVTGPSPQSVTTYGNVLFETVLVREEGGSTRPSAPYGHFKLVPLEEWQRLCVTKEPTATRLTHPQDEKA